MKMKKNRKKEVVRCAVYTRVSTDNQAEKDYSSLESQKEHILNFIKSRKFEGWELFGIYEDAGILYYYFSYNVPGIREVSPREIWA